MGKNAYGKLLAENQQLREQIVKMKREQELAAIVTMQMAKDAAMIAANEALGMGESRAPKFSEAFDSNVSFIVHTNQEDTHDMEYTKDVIDRQLRAICGKHFVPWEGRYYGNMDTDTVSDNR